MKDKNAEYYPKRTTFLVLRGTFIASLLLGVLLIIYNGIVHTVWLVGRTWVVLMIFAYLLTGELLLRKDYQRTVNWMLIVFYVFVAFSTLLLWGLNAPVGILTVSFAVLLPSILMGSWSILPVVCLSIIALIAVQLIHSDGILSPDLKHLSARSTFWDVATYSTVLSIFALVSWLSGNQREKSLKRALLAESALMSQKEALIIELDKESSALRLAQLNQIRHLHKFALLGQSAAATLHELSNHLSILNLDIDDLRQQHSNSKAIANATDGIDHINKMVRQARQQLSSYDQSEKFNAISVVNRSVKDLTSKFRYSKVKLTKNTVRSRAPFNMTGNPMALMQIGSILLNNALDACRGQEKPEVRISIRSTPAKLYISVSDNGPGVDPSVAASLFKPVTSTKPSGLGVGLYIAQHLVKDQFNGKITLKSRNSGATFVVSIPKSNSSENP